MINWLKRCSLLFALCSLYPFSASSAGDSHGLEIKVSRESMEGQFYHTSSESRSHKKTGILFKSVSNMSATYISITTLDGASIFNSFLVSQDTTLMSLMERDYIVVKSLPKDHVYIVPRVWKKMIWRMAETGLPLQHLYKYMSTQNVDTTSSYDFTRLVQSREAQFVQETAMELGRRGLNGRDSPAAMAFYVLAMRLASLKPAPAIFSKPDCKNTLNSHLQNKMWSGGNGDRYHQELQYCSNNKQFCKKCPSGGGTCTGMCGPRCMCWKMVCGTCCHHDGCYGHNRCCNSSSEEGNPVTFKCFNVFGFKCDSPYTC